MASLKTVPSSSRKQLFSGVFYDSSKDLVSITLRLPVGTTAATFSGENRHTDRFSAYRNYLVFIMLMIVDVVLGKVQMKRRPSGKKEWGIESASKEFSSVFIFRTFKLTKMPLQ